ncbi:MAG: iron ABC transporter permease [Candidatus Aenigmarchaeota archaeon]|nr:iron ABC transporter permease [Candidatus Aenigmarchaeota archaeon]
MKLQSIPILLFGLISIIFLTIFFYYPFFSILKDAFSAGENIIKGITDSTNLDVWKFTFLEATLSTILTLVIGLPAGYIFGKYNFPLKRFFLSFLTVPFVLPGVFVALGVITVLGPNGLISTVLNLTISESVAFGWIGILYAHVFYNIPLMIHWVSFSIRQSDPDIEEVARSLGSKGWHKFRRITLPTILPGIIVASLLTFIFCFLSYSVVAILGGISLRTMEVNIASTYKTFPMTGKSMAASLALLQFLIMIVFVYLYMRSLKSMTEKRKVGRSETLKKLPELSKSSIKNLMIIYLTFLFLFDAFIFIGIFNKSLRDSYTNVFTFNNFISVFSFIPNRFLGVEPYRAIFNSLFFALSSVYITSVLAVGALLLREKLSKRMLIILDTFIFLPVAASSITLALGMVRGFNTLNIFYTDVWFFIIVAHSIIGFPFIMRAFSNARDRVDPDLVDTSRSLGSNRLETLLRVEIPLMLPTIIVGMVFTFSLSIGEFTATNFLWEPQATTMPVAIYRFISMRQWGPASAMSVILALVCFVSFLIIYRLSEEGTGIF